MRVDTMRWIDKNVGVPLCFLVTLLVGWILPKPQWGRSRRVLFIELSEMGSAILVDPAMKKIKREAQAELFFLIFSGNRCSLDLIGTIPRENQFVIRDHHFWNLTIDSIRFLWWVRRQKIDTVVDLELFSRFTALLTGLSGVPNRVGFDGFHNDGLYRGHLLTHRVLYNPHLHIAKNFISLANALLATQEETPFSKTVISDQEIQLERPPMDQVKKDDFAKKLGDLLGLKDLPERKILLFNANASEMLIQRRWMPPRFAELARLCLAEDPKALVLFTGSPAESRYVQSIVSEVNDQRCINLAGEIQFHELPYLYAVSDCLVTNDSGPAHFASITSIPTIVLFGPETPSLYGSLGNFIPVYAGLSCSPCVSAANHRKTKCSDNVCLKAITPERVFEKVRPFIHGGSHLGTLPDKKGGSSGLAHKGDQCASLP